MTRSGWFADWTGVERAWLLALILAVVAIYYLPLSAAPLFDVDEGAFSEATREMFVRHDFLSTYLNGAPRYDKPIFIYWLQALSVGALGFTTFAFRLPSAIAATLWVFAVFGFTREIAGRRTALAAAFITATALGVTVIGKAATADAWLNFFLAAAMLDVFRYYRDPRRVYVYRVFLWMGLGFLTKGPVAVLIPAVVSLLYFGLAREWAKWRGAVLSVPGWLIFVAVALPWYAIEYLRDGGGFIQGFFMKHNIERFESPLQHHSGGIAYYLVVALLLVFPYTTLLLKMLTRLRAGWSDALQRYLWIWFFFVLVFFTASGTKLPHYLLYGATPLFILMAIHRDALRSRLLALAPALALMVVLFFLPELVHIVTPKNPDVRLMLQDPREVLDGAYRTGMGVAVAAIAVLLLWRRLSLSVALQATGVIVALAFAFILLPAIAGFKQEPIRAAALMARGAEGPVVVWHLNVPSFSVYSRQVTLNREPRPGDIALVPESALPALAPHQLRYASRGIALVRMLLPGEGGRE